MNSRWTICSNAAPLQLLSHDQQNVTLLHRAYPIWRVAIENTIHDFGTDDVRRGTRPDILRSTAVAAGGRGKIANMRFLASQVVPRLNRPRR